MKFSKLNNVIVKNSLYVLLFVISYTALLRYYNTEFFLDTSIDSVFGWAGNHENPVGKNQTEESCRQLALKDPKYVAWGYRTSDHPDPEWKNTCFLYTQGFQPMNANPSDIAHKTGCLRPGEKVSLGCKVPPSNTPMITQPTTVAIIQPKSVTQIVYKSILDPEYDFNKVVEKKKNSYTGKETIDFVVQLANELVPEHKQLVCIAFYWFIMKKSQETDGYKDDDHWAKSLNEVGLPYEMYANLLPQLLGMTVGAKGTLATLADTVSDNMISVYIQNYVQRYKNFIPHNVQEYKDGLERIDWNNFRQMTSDVETLRPPVNSSSAEQPLNFEAAMHLPLLALTWLNFLLALPKSPNESTKETVWKQSLADVGLPNGIYVSVGKLLFDILNNTKRTFKTVDDKLLAPFENKVMNDYNNYVKANGKFEPADKTKYNNAFSLLEKIVESIENVSVDPSMYTNEYAEQVRMIIQKNTGTLPAQVKDTPTPIQVKPIITAPVFQSYEQNQNKTTATTTATATTTSSTTTTSPAGEVNTTTQPATTTSSFASISSKFVMYILIAFIVSVVFIVLIIWGSISLTKAKTIPNSTF